MRQSPCLSITSAALLAGCPGSGQTCGPGSAAQTITLADASGSVFSFTYGSFTAGANNDCPDPAAPKGVISLTILGTETDGTGLITLCVPRPDKLQGGPLAIGTDVKLIDFRGNNARCSFTSATPMSATLVAHDMCNNGSDAAGFALSFTGAFQLAPSAMCATAPAGQLSGEVAVTFH